MFPHHYSEGGKGQGTLTSSACEISRRSLDVRPKNWTAPKHFPAINVTSLRCHPNAFRDLDKNLRVHDLKKVDNEYFPYAIWDVAWLRNIYITSPGQPTNERRPYNHSKLISILLLGPEDMESTKMCWVHAAKPTPEQNLKFLSAKNECG